MEWREARSVRMARWLTVLLFVGTAHVAGAASSLLWREELVDEEPDGVFVVELAPVTMSANSRSHSMTPGPESDDAVEMKPTVREEREIEREVPDLPALPKVPDAPADLVLPQRVEKATEDAKQEKPEEEQRLQQQEVAAASQASVAARPLQVDDASASTRTAAPTIGLSTRDTATEIKWQREVAAHLGRFKHYPPKARDRSQTGEILLKLALDRSGRVTDVGVARGSGFSVLDDAAVAIAMKASPLPSPPPQVAGSIIELLVPVKFQLKD